MRGIFKFIFSVIALFTFISPAIAWERVGIVSDAILTNVTPYNAYFKTPEFFLQDVRQNLVKSGIPVVSVQTLKDSLKSHGITQYDTEALVALKEGYDIDYKLLKKIARSIGVNKLVILTSSIDIQRDFLKNTIWNVANIPSMDVVNPTHRVSVYVALVDVDNEIVVWEQIYAKNIRNNKFKNLDVTISDNYEGMLRLKEYSKYISPEIAHNVRMRVLYPSYKTPPMEINRGNVKQYVKDMKNVGSRKRLTDINEEKWNSDKFIKDSKETIRDKKDKFVESTQRFKDRIFKHESL